MSARRTLPQGRLERAARLARMGASTGLGLLAGRSTERLAEQATEVLGSLRGMAAKVGQIASMAEGMLPESLDEPFTKALARLRDQTQTSSYAEVAKVIESELHGSIASLFRDFSPCPMASASIGQVHRATLVDGRVVAVKVQHPGIERAMESDLSNVRIMERLASHLVPKGFDADRTFDGVAARFREELDYRIEAENQTRYARLHQSTPGVVVPQVIECHSARRVLTSEFVQGKKFEEMLDATCAADRKAFAETLWRFVFRSILVAGEFNADPHPGNYLFGEPPKITFLDFGCVQRLSPARTQTLRHLHQAALDRDEAKFADGVRTLLATRGGAYEAFGIAFVRRAVEPLFSSPFRVTPDYVRGFFTLGYESKLELLRDRKSATPYPADLALLNRLQLGMHSLLARLDVEVDYAVIQREILEEAAASSWPPHAG
jgi:predicted unusual protein kinase regulating ubiquinone biosynthesis (AarF/ABC1/UbiB family)